MKCQSRFLLLLIILAFSSLSCQEKAKGSEVQNKPYREALKKVLCNKFWLQQKVNECLCLSVYPSGTKLSRL